LFLIAGVQVWGTDEKQFINYQNIAYSSNINSEVMCLGFHEISNYLFGGYKNGYCSAWSLKENYFVEVGITKFHDEVLYIQHN